MLNINELANAVKAVYIPGETLEVHVIQEGKEAGQGVGYLDDGTMVVVEDGTTTHRPERPGGGHQGPADGRRADDLRPPREPP